MNKTYLLLIIVLFVVLLTGCVNKIGKQCKIDEDCSDLHKECYKEDLKIPFCIDGICQCECGNRDSKGNFVPARCI